MEFLFLLLAIFSTLALVVLKNLYRTKLTSHIKKGKEAPEPWGAWPLIGHLHLLMGQKPACRILGAMADKHGPIFTIRLGLQRALVVNSWEGVKECLRDNDLNFLTRPTSAALKYMGYNGALFSFAPYGPYWQAMRKIATRKILSNHQLGLLKHVRASEVDIGIKDLYSLCSNEKTCWALLDMGQWFDYVSINTMVQMIAGKRYCSFGNDWESQRYGRAMKKFMYLSGVFVLSDVIPCIEWLDLQGHLRSMKRNAKELDYLMSSWLEEHLEDRRVGKVKEDRDFMDVLLSSLANEESIFGHKRENITKATALILILAGADTTSVTLTWALSLVLNHPDVLKRAQDELDINIGRERWVEESDFKNLVYLQAIVKETLRLYPPGPLSEPREAMEDCYIAGYYVPKGTRLIVNIWKLHHDPRVWPNPFEFQPERFLTSHAEYDVRGQHFEYIPFSSGRRSCPGVSSALQMISLILARTLQGFNLSVPMNAPVDLSAGTGITLPKERPLEVKLTPRLPHKLYEI